MTSQMVFAYADPPYLGCGRLYDKHHSESRVWDDPDSHRKLIKSLCDGFDAWAMSCSSPSLQTILPMCPPDVRVAAWVKPFASFKPNVNPAYAWEPVIFRGGRKRSRDAATARDWVSANITLKRGLTGAKPRKFCLWMFDLLGAMPGDDFRDIFPGSGAVQAAWDEFCGNGEEQFELTQLKPEMSE